jgi:hypothetical protein
MDIGYVQYQQYSPPAVVVAYQKPSFSYGERPTYVIKRQTMYQELPISLPPAQPMVSSVGLPPPYLPPDPVPLIEEPKRQEKIVDDTENRFMRDCRKWYRSVRECTRIWNSDPDASVSD